VRFAPALSRVRVRVRVRWCVCVRRSARASEGKENEPKNGTTADQDGFVCIHLVLAVVEYEYHVGQGIEVVDQARQVVDKPRFGQLYALSTCGVGWRARHNSH